MRENTKQGFQNPELNESENAEIDAQIRQFREQYALSVSRALLLLGGSASVSEAVLWLLFPDFPQLILLAMLTLPPTISAALFPFLRRKGLGTFGRYFVLTTLMLDIFIGVLMPQFLVAISILTVIVIVLCFLLLGGRDSLWLVGISVLCLAVTVFISGRWAPDWLPPLDETAEEILVVPVTVFTSVVMVVTARLIVTGQDEQFRRAQQANLEIQGRVAIEQEQREQLQQANLEIEQRMAAEQEQYERLQRVLSRARETADHLNQAADEILASSAQQATGADEQSAAISQVLTTIDEVRTIARQTSERAQAVAELAQHTAEAYQTGQRAVADTTQGIQKIKQRSESIASDVLRLSEHAQSIRQIIATVSEIAEQSNVLALNATVEAVHAGGAGKGFAVVAQEVRTLAEQSQSATKQVKEILNQIQHGINTAVMSAEEGMKDADAGVELAGDAGLSIQRLAESVTESSQSALQTAAAAQQQLNGIQQVAQAMESIHLVMVQTVAGAHQVEKAAGELNRLAGELREMIEQD
jgi:methyl-accepting chemotaxis protein